MVIVNPRTGQPFMREVATVAGGRDVTRGWVDGRHWLQPQDDVLLRQGGGNYVLYEDILRDDRVASAFAQRRAAVVAREWDVAPGGDMRRDRAAAAHLKEQLEHVGWDRVTDLMLYGVFYGFAVAEAVWRRDGARVLLDRVAVRNRRRFVFGPDFRPRLLTSANSEGERLPRRKFWAYATGADNDDEPYGRGLANRLYWPVLFKRQGIRYWLTLLDKYGLPTPIGRYPAAHADQQARLADVLRQFAAGSAITVPDYLDVSLLEAARGGTVNYDGFRAAMDRAITTVILSQTMTTEDGSSLSQAEVHLDVRDEIVEADAYLVDDSFNRSVGAWLTAWNFPGAAVPRVHRVMETPARQNRRADRDGKIVAMGWRPTKEYVEETYNVPVEAVQPAMPGPPAAPEPPVRLDEDDDAGGAIEALADNAGERLGPKADAWRAPLRGGLDGVESLAGYRDWLDSDAVDAVDVAPFAGSLGDALAAAELAGMVNSDAPLYLAESEAGGRLPFRAQIEFFRGKVSVPTRTWTDIWQSQHDVAFVVAGAARDGLLADLRGAVDAAIADGETLASFRRRFDEIVAANGWTYRGGRNWRTRVIYETNIATSYAAGRLRQLRAVQDSRPYWRYRHSHASVDPREQHLAWDGLVLSADDPWWGTNYPPNGWGCKCYVESLSPADLERLGKDGPDQAPPLGWREVTVGRGPAARAVRTPEGVDPGFAYQVGASALGSSVEQRLLAAARLPTGIAARGVAEMLARPRALTALAAHWAAWRREDVRGGGPEDYALGALLPAVVSKLADMRGEPQSAAVTITRREGAPAQRRDKARRDRTLDAADMDRLPAVVAGQEAAAVLYDHQDEALLYAFAPAGRDGVAKAVVRIDYRQRVRRDGRRLTVTANAMRTAGYVEPRDLRAGRYEVIWGSLD